MRTEAFTLSDEQLSVLTTRYPNRGKNSDIGKLAVEIVKLYFLSINIDTEFEIGGRNKPDICVILEDSISEYEVKGTESVDVSFNLLRVSSRFCYERLIKGMEMIRVTGIGRRQVGLHFLKYGEDFTMIPEPRWTVRPVRK